MNKKLINTIPILLLIFSLSSCDLSSLTSGLQDLIDSAFNENIAPDVSVGEFDNEEHFGNSLTLLDEAFNGSKNQLDEDLKMDFTNHKLEYEKQDGYEVIDIDKTIIDYEYYDGYMPTKGDVKGLVIPVDFVDYRFNKEKKYAQTKVQNQSVSSFYYNSSYGQLNLIFDILPWYTAANKSSYYENMSEKNQNKFHGDAPGVSCLIHEILTVAAQTYDLSQYDSNKDGNIDSLHIIYNHPIDYDVGDFWWAFQYVTYENYRYDGLYSYSYVFAGFDFLFDYDETNNTRTFIHETGHMLGLEDYYDYDFSKGTKEGGLGGFDMMDCSIGDHNVFSKISLGWIDKVLLVTLDQNEETTITINDSSTSANVIMVCDNYDKEKGMFQTYFLFELIDAQSPLFGDSLGKLTYDGVRVYRINAELKTYTDSAYAYDYYRFDNSYTIFNLIDSINGPTSTTYHNTKYNDGLKMTNNDLFIKSSNYSKLPFSNTTNKMNSAYVFRVENISNNQATISFKRR